MHNRTKQRRETDSLPFSTQHQYLPFAYHHVCEHRYEPDAASESEGEQRREKNSVSAVILLLVP